ncbi:MAG TPA: ATP synthase F1 subunit gamma [Thermoanaerobaculia bacterium]|nr:ATP synthase F1 subunit gamma [Thermoanaerobaculia bacterium]
MASLIDIRRRIRSIKSSQQITKAMKMISAARLRRAQDRAVAARPYARLLREVMASVSSRMGSLEHPLLAEREEKRVAILVVAGDRGLAGAFNTNVNRAVASLLAGKSWEAVTIVPVGKKALDFWRRRKTPLAQKTYSGIFSKIDYSIAKEIADGLALEFEQGRLDAVYVVFNEFRSVISQVVRVEKILPMSRGVAGMATAAPQKPEPAAAPAAAATVEPIFEPDPATILAKILPRYLEFAVFRILLESAAAEHAARMTAMDSASKNAGDLIDSLTLTYNRARQARITKELIEIVSGAAAQG